MFDLERAIAAWREKMAVEGIAGEVRDELESHLRDAVEKLTAQGCPPEAALAEAAARLGAGAALRAEYQAAKTAASRLRTLLQEPVGVFPTELTWCAWAAVPFGIFMTGEVIVDVYRNDLSLVIWQLITERYSPSDLVGILGTLFSFLFGIYPLFAARDYLKKHAFEPAMRLAGFWIVFLWLSSSAVFTWLQAILAQSRIASPWPILISAIAAFVAYQGWKRRLRSVFAARRVK